MHHRAWNQTLEPLGIQLDWDFYRNNFVGVADEVALRERLRLPDRSGDDELVARKQALFRQGLAEAQPFLPDTVRMLEEIRSTV